jgi:hypothetical protein
MCPVCQRSGAFRLRSLAIDILLTASHCRSLIRPRLSPSAQPRTRTVQPDQERDHEHQRAHGDRRSVQAPSVDRRPLAASARTLSAPQSARQLHTADCRSHYCNRRLPAARVGSRRLRLSALRSATTAPRRGGRSLASCTGHTRLACRYGRFGFVSDAANRPGPELPPVDVRSTDRECANTTTRASFSVRQARQGGRL